MWAQGYIGGHGPSHCQEPPWEEGEAAAADDEKERHQLEKLRGEGAEGDDAEAQEVSLLWAPGVWQTTLRVFDPPMQGDDDQAEEVYFLWGPGV